MKLIQTLVLFFIFSSGMYAQSQDEMSATPSTPEAKVEDKKVLARAQGQGLQGGVMVGASNYEGDVVQSDIFNIRETSWQLGFFLRYNVSETVGVRANFFTGKLTGDESKIAEPAFHQQRGISFETSFTELSVLGEIDLLGNRRWRNRKFNRTISPYLFGGVGMLLYLPEADFSRNTLPNWDARIKADEDITKGTSFTVPFGAGIKLDISRRTQLAIEMGARPALHDKLDGVRAAGNPEKNDWYFIGGVSASMRLGRKDSDNDGIIDDKDTCPDVAGVEATGGCPDADADGVADQDDACPNAAGSAKLAGCPDSDGDSVADKNDLCPNQAGMKRFDGCPDSDDDGVPDKDDNCPNTAGLKKVNGCPDSDRDGVADKDDNCPEIMGTEAMKGCPDADGDGITDSEDECPDKAGVAAFRGCADMDGDGIPDHKDNCPGTAGPTTNGGCPSMSSSTLTELLAAAKNIRFNPSSGVLTSESYSDLNKIADILNLYPEYKVSIDGYTDSIGSSVTNMGLSEKRARACYLYLIERGINSNRMTFKGHGESNPIGNNKYKAGRKLNRRVEFNLYK